MGFMVKLNWITAVLLLLGRVDSVSNICNLDSHT